MKFICLLFVALLLPVSSNSLFSQTEHTTIGGYGELHYNEPDGAGSGQLDFHRFVLYLGHQFDDRVSFHSEVEIEHTLIVAGESEGGELSIEQAFLDYRISAPLVVRAGILLAPVGLINQYHEPPTFNGVERPNVDRYIIPTTWREAGIGLHGMITPELQYQAYVVAGLRAEGFDAKGGLRGGRQSALESSPANPSFTGRIDYSPALDTQIGGSWFVGNANENADSVGSATVALLSVDVRQTLGDLELRGVGAIVSVSDADQINARYGNRVADRMLGYYVEGGYNIMPVLYPESEQRLTLFARYERYDTQSSTTGFSRLKQYDRSDVVFGATYKPTYNTCFKVDYTFINNALNTASVPNTKQLNIGIGYFFN